MGKIAISLRQPDRIVLHYGDEEVELKMSTPFYLYTIEIEEEDLVRFKHLLYVPQKGRSRNG